MQRRFVSFFLLAMAGFSLVACGDDSNNGSSDAGSDSGVNQGKAGNGGGKAGNGGGGAGDSGGDKDASVKDSSVGDDAGDDAGSDDGASHFSVPNSGGTFKFTTPGGAKLELEFPASAAGKDITVKAVDPSSATFANAGLSDSFSELIELGPDGTTFSTPVKVKLAKGSLIAFNFHDTEKPADPLLLSGDGAALELTHFSSVAVVDPNNACQSTSGWNDTADATSGNDTYCSGEATKTTHRSYGCKQYAFCYIIQADCCVAPGNTDVGCAVGDAKLDLKYTRVGANGSDYLYCNEAGGTGSYPYVQNITPASFTAGDGDTTITLHGTGFTAGGTIVIGGDQTITTTNITATSAQGLVPAANIAYAGTLGSVGFVPATADATGICSNGTSNNCDWNSRSNYIDMPINQ